MQNLEFKTKKDVKEYWSFRNLSTKKFTHGLHKYPARMHPEIAKKIIQDYATDQKIIVTDPFVGSAGVLIEAMLHGNNSIGFDVNPLAILLSKVKTTIVNPEIIEDAYIKILEKSKNDYREKKFYPKLIPEKLDIDFWYKPNVFKKLSIIKHHIWISHESEKVKNFLKICLSQTIRNVSNQRNYEFKIYRMSRFDLNYFYPNVFESFSEICSKNCTLMHDFKHNMSGKKVKTIVKLGNSVDIFENIKKLRSDIFDEAKGHLVMTSSPYGDHKTTVAYGQFSYHSGLWLDLPQEQLKNVDKIGMGGTKHTFEEQIELGSPKLKSTIREIVEKDVGRANDVFSFFFDFDRCLDGLSKILKTGKSHLCFVVANRTVKRTSIKTDKILIDLAKNHGFKHEITFHRFIPIKVMPYKNAPENILNNIGKTMAEESIVILKY